MMAIFRIVVLSLLAGVAAAEEVHFRVFSEAPPAFDVFRVTPVAEPAPVFAVFSEPEKVAKPVVIVAIGDIRTCAPCKRAKLEIERLTEKERELLPFELKIGPPPEPINVTPVCFWKIGDRRWKHTGWSGIDDLERTYLASVKQSFGT